MIPCQPITLSELQGAVKATLLERFALPVWVVAEVAELKVNYSGHCYIELVEKGAKDGVPKAQARAVIWRSHYPRIAGYFEAETGHPLGAGLQILVKATINYHEIYGFSLQISDIDPAYTLGDMARQRQQTIARLQQEGVWDLNRELAMPVVVQRIAVVSSRNAAGWQDFHKELQRSPYAFRVELFEAFMQGEAAEDSIVAALYAISERMECFDAVVVIRGGGSSSDLNCFNSYRLSNHIAQFPLPVLTGIGHDKDQSVADLVAHTPLKTPTAVAGWLVERMQRVEGWLGEAALQLHDAALTRSRHELLQIERLASELKSESLHRLQRETSQLEQLRVRLPEVAGGRLDQLRRQLQLWEEVVASHAPERILRLGFAILRHNRQAIVSTRQVKMGEPIEIEVTDGVIQATVTDQKIRE